MTIDQSIALGVVAGAVLLIDWRSVRERIYAYCFMAAVVVASFFRSQK